MYKLLVIGGSGFFGKSILDAFQRGLLNKWQIIQVIVVARHATKLRESHPLLVKNNVVLLDLDITQAEDIPFADYVIHAAASTDARNYQQSPKSEMFNISEGINNYGRLALKFHQKSKIVFTSSGAVYGQQPSHISNIEETYHDVNFKNMSMDKFYYAQAKREAESIIQNLAKDGLQCSIARCFAFVGKYLPRDQHFAIGNFLDNALNGKPISVKANHQVYRSYMYADDLVEWLMKIADYANTSCPIFNVGSDQETSIVDLAKIISRKFDLDCNITEITDTKVDRYIPSTLKARKLLNLSLKFDLKNSIDQTLSF